MLEVKLNVVNKKEYAENHNYREVVIRIPKQEVELKNDFKYLGLEYEHLEINDSHILECSIIESDNPHFSKMISMQMTNVIKRAEESGWSTPFQEIINVYESIKKLDNIERQKLLAVLELKQEQILTIRDVFKHIKHLDCFKLYEKINSSEDYAEYLIKRGDLEVEYILDYIDLNALGEECCKENNGLFTKQGLIVEDISKYRYWQEEEEEEDDYNENNSCR